MEVLLIRHGLPHVVDPTTEAADPALDATGIEQAQLLAVSLKRGDFGPIGAIFSSSMLRARQTAEPFAALSGLSITIDPRLVELDAGAREYGKVTERFATRAALWDAVNDGQWAGLRFDPTAFAARAIAGIEDAVAANPNQAVAIFCHGGVINAYLAHVLRAERKFFFSPEYTSVSRFLALEDGYRELLSVAETPHLRR